MSQNTTPSPAELSELASGLHRLARNLWWTWDQDSQEIFQELSPRAWSTLYHNAVAVLGELSDYELKVRLLDDAFTAKVRRTLDRFHAYLESKGTWAANHAAHTLKRPVAYFSAEFGFHETLPIAAGGLGMLAGDHTKAASDLGLGFVGISLFYREGYFQQAINHENWQTEYYTLLDPKNLPVEPVLDAKGDPVICSVHIAMATVKFRAFRVNVGRCPCYLLDTNLPENQDRYRDLTLRVYGGDSTTRIMQEILLGVGGVKLMRELGITPSFYHMNEGHAAFLTLELIREKLAEGKSMEEAQKETTAQCLFTTHTPVPAGHDRFSSDLIDYAGHSFLKSLGLGLEEFMDFGRVTPGDVNESFCMTVLALKFSKAANGVSELHGQVSREMWTSLYPDRPVDQVPIGHVTNGIHLMGWTKGSARSMWRNKLALTEGKPASEIYLEDYWNEPEFWKKMEDPNFISDEEIWAMRYKLRRELIEFARRRLLLQGHHDETKDFITFDRLLNPDALTIGFARRFATYKRAPLIFKNFEEIVGLVKDSGRPIQFIFAGKAHPRDDEGKRFIQHIIHLSKFTELHSHLVFIENYDMQVARQMVAGCDIWLNNPRRPLEASGTSGMKCSVHGCLNLSILDGWWREGYDGENGFAIGEDNHPESIEEQDNVDADNLYKTLVEQVIPSFYNRDANGIPHQWIQKIRHTMATLVPEFTTIRMVQEYTEQFYKE